MNEATTTLTRAEVDQVLRKIRACNALAPIHQIKEVLNESDRYLQIGCQVVARGSFKCALSTSALAQVAQRSRQFFNVLAHLRKELARGIVRTAIDETHALAQHKPVLVIEHGSVHFDVV